MTILVTARRLRHLVRKVRRSDRFSDMRMESSLVRMMETLGILGSILIVRHGGNGGAVDEGTVQVARGMRTRRKRRDGLVMPLGGRKDDLASDGGAAVGSVDISPLGSRMTASASKGCRTADMVDFPRWIRPRWLHHAYQANS